MNRFVSLLLVAFSLVTVGLAQPAQAQWVKCLPFYDHNNSHSAQPATTSTSETPVGYINITASPTSDYNHGEYGTGGTYTGSVDVYYVWTNGLVPGGPITQPVTLTTTQSYEATGSGNGTSGGSSMAGGPMDTSPLVHPAGIAGHHRGRPFTISMWVLHHLQRRRAHQSVATSRRTTTAPLNQRSSPPTSPSPIRL